MRLSARTLAIACAPVLSAWAVAAHAPSAQAADPKVTQCLKAYEEGQRLRLEARFLDAKEQLVVCSAEHCPPDIASDCLRWMGEVQTATPSVVIHALGPQGEDVVNVRVWLDGKLVADKLDGKAMALDPGQHAFRFELEGMAPVDRELLIREREQGRPIDVKFRPAAADDAHPAPAPVTSRSTPAAAWVLGGVGLAALGVFGYFGLRGQGKRGELDDLGCKPNCAQTEVDSIKRDYLIANVGLAASAVSLGVATWLFVTSKPSPGPAVAVDVGWSAGPTAALRATF